MKIPARLLVAAALLVASPAAASPVDEAKTFYDAGVQAYAAGRYAASIQAFNEAYRLVPKQTILFSLAQAERHQYTAERDPKSLADAIVHFRRYIAEVPQGGRRADAVDALSELESAANRLEKSPPSAVVDRPGSLGPTTRLMVTTPTKNVTATLDGTPHAELPLIEEVKPGKHVIRLSAPGYADEERELIAVEGTLVPLEITLREMPSFLELKAPNGARISVDGRPYGEAPLADAIEMSPGAHLVSVTQTGHHPYLAPVTIERGATLPLRVVLPRTRQRIVSYAVFGGAAAAAIGGVALSVTAILQQRTSLTAHDELTAHTITQARLDDYNGSLAARDTLRRDAVVTFGIAGALGLTAAGLYLFDDPAPSSRETQRAARTPKVSFTFGPTSIGLRGAF